jgi:hypothetical protein
MENTNVNVNEQTTEQSSEQTVEKTQEPTVKTFTQEEVDKMIQKRLSRERKDIEAKIEAERREAEELAKLSEAEKQKKLFEKQVAEFEATKKAFEQEKLLNETSKQLASKNLPIEFAEMLKAEDAESTFENIKIFEAKFNEAVEKLVNERLKGKTPKAQTGAVEGVTKEAFNKMSYMERLELYNSDPELYNKLK